MGLMGTVLTTVFGGGRNAIAETAEVFRENAEAGAVRDASGKAAVLAQFAEEFRPRGRGGFDRFMDGLNRVPRPALALGCLGLFVAAMTDPLWFSARMQGVELVPEPLWWLMGVIVSFYFGARHQAKGQDLQRSIAVTLAHIPEVAARLSAIEARREGAPVTGPAAEVDEDADPNPALAQWQAAEAREPAVTNADLR